MNWLANLLGNINFEMPERGTLKLIKDVQEYVWFGRVKFGSGPTPVELSIELAKGEEPTKIESQVIDNLEEDWEEINDLMFTHMTEKFKDSKWEKQKDELEDMYFLSSISLKREKSECWIVLEPKFNVYSFFNFFPRFTIKDKEIIWSNL